VVRISSGPLSGFGANDEYYSTKGAAKKAAARQAVLWLRSRGEIVKDALISAGPTPPSKRRKSLDVKMTETDAGNTGLTQGLSEVDVDFNSTDNVSLAKQVHDLVASLGFSQPSWRPKVSKKHGPPFIDMAAEFTPIDIQREPRLAGEVGKVEGCLGKKPAKERCCIEVLRFLEDLKSSRSG